MANHSSIELLLSGDSIVTRGLNQGEEPFQKVYDLVSESDVSFTNLEVPLHDYDAYPAAGRGAFYFRGPPRVASQLRSVGFNLVAAANNHIGDYTQKGMISTMNELEQTDLAYAGLGDTLADARAPAFVDTPSGRVALIAATTTFVPGSQAGDSYIDLPGRPGLSPVRLRTRYVVSEESFEKVVEVADELGLDRLNKHRSGYLSNDDGKETFEFLNVGGGTAGDSISFERGEEPRIYRTPREEDVSDIVKQIEWASQQSEWVVMSVHSHEGANGTYSDRSVPPFLENFAHRCIDAGADVFVTHGPHQLRGIEIYDDKPIFYSLGNFIVQHDTTTRFPSDALEFHNLERDATPADFYNYHTNRQGEPYEVFKERRQAESVLPVCNGRDGIIESIELYPLELGYGKPYSRKGLPRMPGTEESERILSNLSELSQRYGTAIESSAGVGSIHVGD